MERSCDLVGVAVDVGAGASKLEDDVGGLFGDEGVSDVALEGAEAGLGGDVGVPHLFELNDVEAVLLGQDGAARKAGEPLRFASVVDGEAGLGGGGACCDGWGHRVDDRVDDRR